MKVYDIFGALPARRPRMGDAPPPVADLVGCPITNAPGLYQIRHGTAPYDYVSANAVAAAELSFLGATPVAAGDPRCPVDATPAPYLCPTTPGMSAIVDLKTGTKMNADSPGNAIDNPGCPGYAARQAAPPPQPQPTPVIVIQPPFGFGQPGYPGYPPGYAPIGQYPPGYVPAPAPAAAPAPTPSAAATAETSVDTVALVSGVGAVGLIAALAAGVFGK